MRNCEDTRSRPRCLSPHFTVFSILLKALFGLDDNGQAKYQGGRPSHEAGVLRPRTTCADDGSCRREVGSSTDRSLRHIVDVRAHRPRAISVGSQGVWRK